MAPGFGAAHWSWKPAARTLSGGDSDQVFLVRLRVPEILFESAYNI